MNNELGSAVLSSIDVNGQSIIGKMSMNELKVQAANAHKQYLELEKNLKAVEEQEKLLVETSRIPTSERPALTLDYVNANRNNPFVVDYLDKIKNFKTVKDGIRAKMNSPEISGLNDAYKQLYVNSKKGTLSTIYDAAKNFIQDATTYSKYKPQLKQQRKEELEKEYEELSKVPSMQDLNNSTYDEKLQNYNKTFDDNWANKVKNNLPIAKYVAQAAVEKRDEDNANQMIANAESENKAL